MNLRPLAALNAMRGPQGLLAVTQFDLLVGLFARMRGCERRVMLGVPILGEDDVFKQRSDAMDGADHGVSIGNGKRPARAEIVLHVNDDENIVRVDPHRVSSADHSTGTFILSNSNQDG